MGTALVIAAPQGLINLKTLAMLHTTLRIGNYLHDRDGRLCKVEEIQKYKEGVTGEGFKAPSIQGPITALPHSPIPLTKEWLLKFGFKYNSLHNVYDLGVIEIYISENGNITATLEFDSTVSGSNSFPINCEHVHELQNLYIVLNGEEIPE